MREQIVHRRPLGIGDADHDVVLLFPQVGCDAGNGSARPDGADEAVNSAVSLLPDLGAGGEVVGLPVVQVVPLVCKQDAVRLVLAQLVRQAAPDMLVIVRVRIGGRWHLDELGAA